MKFPYPEKPESWQTAYTRDDAHADSGKYGQWSSLALVISAVIISAFIAIKTSNLFDISYLRPYQGLGSVFILVIIAFLLLLVIQSGTLRFVSAFLIDFHQPPEDIQPTKIINYRLYGRLKLPPPLNMFVRFQYILVNDGAILKSDEWPAWCSLNLGGPIQLIIFDGCALYLERGNRFSRVVGPGEKIPFLEWYETIKYVVDLRPKVKDGIFNAWTKDGINIKLKAQIECRIGNPKNNNPANNLVYPFDPIAVKKAIERYAVQWPDRTAGEPVESTWIDSVWGQVTGIVPTFIGSRMLDDLFIADRRGGQILSPKAVQEIFEKLNQATQVFGVFVTDFQVLEITFPKQVEDTQKEQWKAERQGITTVREGETSALNIRSQEKANAEAQRDLILTIANGLEKIQDGKYDEPLLLSLSRMLDESLDDPLLRAYLARETLETLEKIKEMLK